MASKHGRDQAMDFQGFLNDLQDWELSLRDKDKKKLSQASGKEQLGTNEKGRPAGKRSLDDSLSTTSSVQYDYLQNYDKWSSLSTSFGTEENMPDANSEKELGNEYFKQKKFKEAIDCYSRSIALSPTAVAYANRAMAYLKIRKFQEAEDDCTEALNLDDRYIKAYSRRATARKELGKFKESVEDAEFGLRLEPKNQEMKKQHAEFKALYEKEVLQKASGVIRRSMQGGQDVGKLDTQENGLGVQPVLGSTQRKGVAAVQEHQTKKNTKTRKQELKPSVQELASRAASRAMTDAAKNVSPPNTAYQFEVSWKALSGDSSLQAHLLKVTSPTALPHIFKNAMSASMLVDIVKCVATFFREEIDLAIKYLENLTKVPRFDMLVLFLSPTDKADLLKVWDEVFCSEATPIQCAEILDNLRSMYGLKK
ncbi:Tetratricopeptide repeat (TPR)-like superfamily protein, putative isoform 2 [Hibiscus syriacus]|uniref:Tetratricopeptide repeat (TPR)-like superfamily protein, putative isoform 2 n=1 Tax=Hibiscus syriacus TaxID=106335 RepID=A0A6A2YHM9_HIBSY|nr:Tetratricopeptide repeat (TPR)-like superfamily protein, putative isoform 2 [Hibiscus syriacus]